MVDHEVHDESHAAGLEIVDQHIKVRQAAEKRVDVLQVADVIPLVVLRGGVNGGVPHHTEPVQVVELANDSSQVPDAVPVGVGEAAGVDLVDHRALEPVLRLPRNGLMRGLYGCHLAAPLITAEITQTKTTRLGAITLRSDAMAVLWFVCTFLHDACCANNGKVCAGSSGAEVRDILMPSG